MKKNVYSNIFDREQFTNYIRIVLVIFVLMFINSSCEKDNKIPEKIIVKIGDEELTLNRLKQILHQLL